MPFCSVEHSKHFLTISVTHIHTDAYIAGVSTFGGVREQSTTFRLVDHLRYHLSHVQLHPLYSSVLPSNIQVKGQVTVNKTFVIVFKTCHDMFCLPVVFRNLGSAVTK